MTEPLVFQSTSPRYGLPFLFSAQAQKEVLLNEAIGRLDVLVQLAVEGELAVPPIGPSEGQSWIVGDSPTGEWSSQAGKIAAFVAGDWAFVTPLEGMRCWDKTRAQFLHFNGGWNVPQTPAIPDGGTTVDSESRAAIGEIINSLTLAGILPD